jgi:hypothetical protein
LRLLEDQVLVATSAQETRDLIKILAGLFKTRGENAAILTAADFQLEDDNTGIGALLDSVSNQHHASLRERALRNITSVIEAIANPDTVVPHLEEIMGSLWLRSIAVANVAGAEPSTLQIDCTRGKPLRTKAKVKARVLGDADPDEWDLPPKPKWMRWRTYERWEAKYDQAEDVLDEQCALAVERLLRFRG